MRAVVRGTEWGRPPPRAAQRRRPAGGSEKAHNFDTNFDTIPYQNPSHAITLHPRGLRMAASKILALRLRILAIGGRRNGGQREN